MTNALPIKANRGKIRSVLVKKFSDINATYKSEQVVQIVKAELKIEYIFPDTILRYLRELREEGAIKYACKCKQQRIFEFTN